MISLSQPVNFNSFLVVLQTLQLVVESVEDPDVGPGDGPGVVVTTAATSQGFQFLVPSVPHLSSTVQHQLYEYPCFPQSSPVFFLSALKIVSGAPIQAQFGVGSGAGPRAGPVTGPVVGPGAGPRAGPVAGPGAGPVAGPVIGPVAEPVVGPRAGPVAGPGAEPVTIFGCDNVVVVAGVVVVSI